MNIFLWLTPIVYWLLIVLWLVIILLYVHQVKGWRHASQAMKSLLAVLLVDGIRTLIEILYFGAWYTARVELLPESWFNVLVQPHLVFIPKVINLLAAILVITILLRRWLPKLQDEQIQQSKDITRLNEEINQRRQAESALLKQERAYRLIFEFSVIGMVVLNEQGRVDQYNPAFSNIVGYHNFELTEMDFRDLLHPEDRDHFAITTQKMLAGNLPRTKLESRILQKNGNFILSMIAMSLSDNADEDALQFVLQIVDKTAPTD
jgi:PAS domain S-box-containing protein